MGDLLEELTRAAGRYEPRPDELIATLQLIRRRRRRRAMEIALGAVAIACAGLLVAVVAFGVGRSAAPPVVPATTGTAPTPFLGGLGGRLVVKCGDVLCLVDRTGIHGIGEGFCPSAPGPQWDPAWAPDGTRIAYRGYSAPRAEGTNDLYLLTARTCRAVRLTYGLNPTDPSWSPNGSRIAFDAGDASGAIDVIGTDGRGLAHLTAGPRGGLLDGHPAWSPDGSSIAFVRTDLGRRTTHVFVIGADGSGLRRVSAHPAEYVSVAWSPDGAQLAVTEIDGGKPSVWLLDITSGQGRRLTSAETWDPRWVPDGHAVLVLASVGSATWSNLEEVPVDGGPPIVLYRFPAAYSVEQFDWTPRAS